MKTDSLRAGFDSCTFRNLESAARAGASPVANRTGTTVRGSTPPLSAVPPPRGERVLLYGTRAGSIPDGGSRPTLDLESGFGFAAGADGFSELF